MAIPVKCPNPACGKQYNLKDDLAGKTVRCAACKQPFEVPAVPKAQQSQALSIIQPGAAPSPVIGGPVGQWGQWGQWASVPVTVTRCKCLRISYLL